LTWSGASGNWLGAETWKDATGNPTQFGVGDRAIFDGTGATNQTITLSGNILSKGVTVSGATNYTFSGEGGFNDANMTLEKNGEGTLTILTNNGSTGTMTINGGSVVLGDDSTLGSWAGNIVNNGSLTVNTKTNGSLTMGRIISGTGALVKNGAGTLVLSGVNTYSGGTTINAGTLQISNSSALGAGMTSVKSGGILEATSAMTLNVSKLDIQKGSILKYGENALTLNTDGKESTLNGNLNAPATLTINGGGTLVFNGIHNASGGNSGERRGGSVWIENATLDLSQGGKLLADGWNSSAEVRVNQGGKLIINSWMYGDCLGGLGYETRFFINGGTVCVTATTSDADSGRILTLQGVGDHTNTLDAKADVNWTLLGEVKGAGSLTKTGAGTIILNHANTYSGGTIIKEGTVKAGNITALGAGNVTINGGTLDATNKHLGN
ncbi:MAG: autotransporter-associated beta strand repeat-containing protein, partial [Akkermansia sp.]